MHRESQGTVLRSKTENTMKNAITKLTAASLMLLTLTSCSGNASQLGGTPSFTLPEQTESSKPDTTAPADSSEDTDPADDATFPSYDFAVMDLSALLTLPEGYAERNYSEGLELLGAPSDEQIDAEIRSSILLQLATYPEQSAGADATVQDLDRVIMDYKGMLDGVAFDGGTATDTTHDISILYSEFIDGFDRGMLGMKEGETRDLNLKFPDEYGKATLAGKEVVFTVTVDKIIRPEIPALTDELVSSHPDLFGDEYTTAAAFRQAVADAMTEDNKASDDQQIKDAVWGYLAENTVFLSLPEDMLAGYENYIYSYYVSMAKQYSITIDELVTQAGYLSVEAFKQEVVKTSATDILKDNLIKYAAAADLGISFTDEQVMEKAQEEFKTYIEPNITYYTYYYGVTDFDSFINNLWSGLGEYKNNMIYNAVLDRLSNSDN